MQCPKCTYPDSKVIKSMYVNKYLKRRRECIKCGNRYTTEEVINAHKTGRPKESKS